MRLSSKMHHSVDVVRFQDSQNCFCVGQCSLVQFVKRRQDVWGATTICHAIYVDNGNTFISTNHVHDKIRPDEATRARHSNGSRLELFGHVVAHGLDERARVIEDIRS
jgi:hypothetical protein